MTDCTANRIEFSKLGRRKLEAEFNGVGVGCQQDKDGDEYADRHGREPPGPSYRPRARQALERGQSITRTADASR